MGSNKHTIANSRAASTYPALAEHVGPRWNLDDPGRIVTAFVASGEHDFLWDIDADGQIEHDRRAVTIDWRT